MQVANVCSYKLGQTSKFQFWCELGWFLHAQSQMLCISRMHRASSTQFSTILYIQGNSFGVLFNGLLVEFPAILDSFFTSTTSDYIRWLAGVVGSHKVAGKDTCLVLTPP